MDKKQEKLKNLPQLPGVYIMKDEGGSVIYVGKSKNLKNRVSQYFKKTGHGGKVGAMVENISDFEYIVTDSETEALVLECNLIKKYKPHYNILLKDDKTYPYIKITADEYPKILLARKTEKDGAAYYGPYTGSVANETIDVIRRIFKIPNCKKVFPRDIGKHRPCLNYHINMCMAPCCNKVSKEEYLDVFRQIKRLLDGKTSEVIAELKARMKAYSDELEFEKAAQVRDKIESLKKLREKQKITVYGRSDKDVIAAACDGGLCNVQVLSIREGKLIGRNKLWLVCSLNEDLKTVISSFLTQYYMNAEFIPKEILLNAIPDDKEVIESWLFEKSGIKSKLIVPQKGMSRDLVVMAEKNAMQEISDTNKLKAAQKKENETAVSQLEAALGIAISRVEAYDISNTQGKHSVGSMVVFENGVPEKSQYRYFKIKTVDNIDDYKSTREVIHRRFKRWTEKQDEKFGEMPDAIFADGGYAHANAILTALKEVGMEIPVFGMVKDVSHRTRALLTTDGEIIPLPDEAFRLVCEIQEEVHRVAITFHRRLMTKDMSRSALDDIEGIGPVKKRSLLRHFGSVAKIKSASIEELCEAEGISRKNAETVYKFFNE